MIDKPWKLTEDEIAEFMFKAQEGRTPGTVNNSRLALCAQAQARKLVKWQQGDCVEHHKGLFIVRRVECQGCMEQLREGL